MKVIKEKDLKETMKEVRARWREQCLDIKVFFDEVLLNLESYDLRDLVKKGGKGNDRGI